LSPQLEEGSLPLARRNISSTTSRIESNVGGALVSVANADSSSPKQVRAATSSSVSLVEIPTILLEDALTLTLDFLLVTVVHCWLSTMSGWTHTVSPRGVGTGIRLFSF